MAEKITLVEALHENKELKAKVAELTEMVNYLQKQLFGKIKCWPAGSVWRQRTGNRANEWLNSQKVDHYRYQSPEKMQIKGIT